MSYSVFAGQYASVVEENQVNSCPPEGNSSKRHVCNESDPFFFQNQTKPSGAAELHSLSGDKLEGKIRSQKLPLNGVTESSSPGTSAPVKQEEGDEDQRLALLRASSLHKMEGWHTLKAKRLALNHEVDEDAEIRMVLEGTNSWS